MAFTKLILAEALVGLSGATFIPSQGSFTPPSADPYCALIQHYPDNHFLQGASAVSAFCTDYFPITTSTGAQGMTTTSTAVATITVAPTAASYSSTQTCFQNTVTTDASSNSKRWFSGSAGSKDPVAPYKAKNPLIYSACSCFGVNFAPSSHSMNTKTVSTTTTMTVTASATATSQVKTVYVPSTGSYTSTNGSGTVFTEYNGFDFPGGDLARGECKAGVPSEVDTSAGNFEYCVGFDSCLDVCSAYNAANSKKAMPDSSCVGVSYDFSGGYCYLKSAVPGNGAANCMPHPDSNIESAIVGVVSTNAQPAPGKDNGTGMSSKQASMQCKSHQTLKCCNTKQQSSILPISLGCLDIPVLSALGSLSGQCSSNTNQAFCCSNNQEGLININAGCSPISLF